MTKQVRSRQVRKLPVGTIVFDDGDVWEVVKPAEQISEQEYKVFLRPTFNGRNTRTFIVDRKYRVHVVQVGETYIAA